MKTYTILLFLFVLTQAQAQEFSVESLLTKSDEDLLSLFNKVSEDSLVAEKIVRVYLNRARKEEDTIKMARGYDRLARIYHPEKNIMFADSVISLTKDMNDKTYPAMGYILKSYEYQRLGDLILKTENAIIGYKLALKNENISQQIFISDYLIYTKSIWGNKKEALELQKERHRLMSKGDYFRKIKESTRKGIKQDFSNIHLENELSSILNFVFCYLNLRDMDSTLLYYNKGIRKLEIYNGPYKVGFDEWFQECSVEIDFYSGNYQKAIQASTLLLKDSKKNLTKSSYLNLNFFKGLSYINYGEYVEGINYLTKADSIFELENISLQPYHRALFEKLLEYYDAKKDTKKEIKYLNRLLFVDSIFKKNYKFFEPDIIRNFETPKLLKEKEDLIKGLKLKNEKATYELWLGIGVLFLCLLLLSYYFKRQLLFKRKFEKLMNQKESENEDHTKINTHAIEMSSNIIEDILTSLERFEKNKHFLSQKISLNDLAGQFKTNPKYLSQVINLQKEKNFSQYINDLRVDYALKELKENKRFRKFTIKAIAADCGFKSSESFSKGFSKRHGIYPSYYIKRLENLID